MRVYLAGPIAECSDADANEWRSAAKELWPDHRDPMDRDMRGVQGWDIDAYIVEGDKADIKASDAVVANCWKPSVGTSMEILHGWTLGKPVVVVVPDFLPVSPWLRYHSSAVCLTLEAAAAELERLFS